MPGYIVERHLKDGDWVIFNRQPSLHRMSMMGHRVRIMDGKTFRLHLCVTTPYNADFDGDEMNLHVPQTEEARVELKELMDVNKHIRTPRYGLPLIGAKQDHLMGLYLLTQDGVKLTKREVASLLFSVDIDVDLDKEEYTGKEVFSFLLPKINYYGKTKSGDDVVIEEGILKKGYINIKSIGAESGELLNKIDLEYGSEKAAEFLEKCVVVSLLFLSIYSYTISLLDYTIDKESRKEMYKHISKKIKDYINSGGSDKTQLELEKVIKDIEQIIREKLSKKSYARIAAEIGARGSLVSVSQIIGCIGQEKLKGRKITRGYYGRTLPCFKKYEANPSAYGFVSRGYREGVSPPEFFFDAMHGREGLSDTALKTKHSGYLERRLVNSLHDLIVCRDDTIRNEKNQIIQFKPLENNVNPYTANKGKIFFEDIL